jgi:hypothetical protein
MFGRLIMVLYDIEGPGTVNWDVEWGYAENMEIDLFGVAF